MNFERLVIFCIWVSLLLIGCANPSKKAINHARSSQPILFIGPSYIFSPTPVDSIGKLMLDETSKFMDKLNQRGNKWKYFPSKGECLYLEGKQIILSNKCQNNWLNEGYSYVVSLYDLDLFFEDGSPSDGALIAIFATGALGGIIAGTVSSDADMDLLNFEIGYKVFSLKNQKKSRQHVIQVKPIVGENNIKRLFAELERRIVLEIK